jgi:hypothetical protein
VEVSFKDSIWGRRAPVKDSANAIYGQKKTAVVNGFALLPGMDTYECVFQPDKSDGRKFLFPKGNILRCLLY